MGSCWLDDVVEVRTQTVPRRKVALRFRTAEDVDETEVVFLDVIKEIPSQFLVRESFAALDDGDFMIERVDLQDKIEHATARVALRKKRVVLFLLHVGDLILNIARDVDFNCP